MIDVNSKAKMTTEGLPMLGHDLSWEIKRANREVYNQMSVAQYNANESLFNPQREAACRATLTLASERSGRARYLDVGTGSGNLLRLAGPIFARCFAVDIGDHLLAQIRPEFPGIELAAADAEMLPFRDGSFNCVSCYAMLHHLYRHETVLGEAWRVLRPGGTLYTDHDPNYFLNRFYRPWYLWRHRQRPGFGSPAEELAEYHNTVSPGINPEQLVGILRAAGFAEVKVAYRMTDRPHWPWPMRLAVGSLRLAAKIYPAKSFFSHFSIIAVK
jgi:ubiquinone/menaquinone biosynthesis C-methylase UbiE